MTLAGAGVTGVALAYGCSLGLDASRIGANTRDASLPLAPDTSTQDVTAPAIPDASPAEAEAEAGPAGCLQNADCTSTNGCQVGSCDAGACSFAVCPSGVCQGSSCNGATSTCTAPTAYGFHAAEVNVTTGPVGCGGNPAACIAAAYPFVFVGTANGVVAYAVNDPASPSPPQVPITGLPFLPAFLTSMGSRVFFVGTPEGTGPTYRLAVASLDVPADPLAKSLPATTALSVVSVSDLASAWAGTDGSLFLSNNDSSQLFPAANVAPPFVDGAQVRFFTSPGVAQGAYAVIPSGSRLVMQHWQGAATPFQTAFSFETGAGTASAQNAGETATLADIGPTGPGAMYAQGSDGSVVWNTATSVVDDAGGNDFGSVRVAWLVADGTTKSFAPTPFVDVEVYAPPVPYGTYVVGPVVSISSSTALVLAAAAGTVGPGSEGQTSVQLAVSTPKPALASGRRYVVAQGVTQVGAAASGGFGYVLAAGVSGAPSCVLHVFAPGCAAGP